MTQQQLEQMQLEVITKYGHENPKTIRFCEVCAKYKPKYNWLALVMYKRLMK